MAVNAILKNKLSYAGHIYNQSRCTYAAVYYRCQDRHYHDRLQVEDHNVEICDTKTLQV